jgi:hypothetical protein
VRGAAASAAPPPSRDASRDGHGGGGVSGHCGRPSPTAVSASCGDWGCGAAAGGAGENGFGLTPKEQMQLRKQRQADRRSVELTQAP